MTRARPKPWTMRVAALAVASLAAAGLTGVAAAPAHAGTITTKCTLMAKNNPSTLGQPASFRFFAAASLPEEVGPPPVGVVTFFDGTSLLGTKVIAPASLEDAAKDNDEVTYTTSDLSLGDHTIFAVMVADTGPCPGVVSASQHVNPPPASPSSTSISSSVNPSKYQQGVTLTATVARDGGGAVAGTVQFKADGNDLGGAQSVAPDGTASVSTADLSVGNHAITAAFTSSNLNTLDSSGTLGGGQQVDPADTSTSVTSSNNPSEFGASVTFTASTSVLAPGGGSPTGSIQFQDNGANLGAAQPLSGGQASVSTSGLAVGTHTISATYSSDSPNDNGSSGTLSQVVNKARTTLTYDGSTTARYDDSTVLSARLSRTSTGAALPGATVTLSMASESCSAVTDVNGEAACSITPSEAAGNYTASASYAGDGNYLPSSTSTPFTVTKQLTTTTYTGPTVIAAGGPVTLSGQLLEKGVKPIVGRSLTLTLGSGATAQSCVAGPTDAAGNAHCTVSNVTVGQGPQPVRADFAGDAYFLPSSDASKSAVVFAFPARGIFLVGDRSAVAKPSNVTFWGAQWAKANDLSGGSASPSFKGFAAQVSTAPPRCGATWTSSPGASSNPVSSVPAYMGVAVTTKVAKSGSNLSGSITHIVVVRTAAGYGPDPGKSGTGSIIATYC